MKMCFSYLTFAHPEVLDTSHKRTRIFSFDKALYNCIEQYLIECNGSVVEVFDRGLKCCCFKHQCQQICCVVSLSKTYFPQLINGSIQEDPF